MKKIIHLLAAMLLWLSLPALALSELADSELEAVNGGGLAIVLDNIAVITGPQSYIHSLGSTPSGTTLQQGDFYWFGWSISGDQSSAGGYQWASGSSCDVSAANIVAGTLGCPIGGSLGSPETATIAPFDNPYVLRVFPYNDPGMNGSNVTNTVLELVGPTCVGAFTGNEPGVGCAVNGEPQDKFRDAFWGAVQVTATAAPSSSGILKDQLILEGNPAALFYPGMTASVSGLGGGAANMYRGSAVQLFRSVPNETPSCSTCDSGSFAFIEDISFSGNLRFSTSQTGADADGTLATVPDFDDSEGMYWRNMQVWSPLGELNYQPITFSYVNDNSGNFIISLASPPNQSNAYTPLYGLETSGTEASNCSSGSAQCGYQTTHDAECPHTGGVECNTGGSGDWSTVAAAGDYFQTHGYFQIGLGLASSTTTASTYGLQGCSAFSNSTATTPACSSSGASMNGSRTYSPTSTCSGVTCYATTTNSSTLANIAGDGVYFSSGNAAAVTIAAGNTDISCTSTSVCPGYKTTASTTVCTCNTYYQVPNVTAVNLGTVNIQGVLLQNLSFTTLGAN